jgi:hypothetical protein
MGQKIMPPKLLLNALADLYTRIEDLGVCPVLAGGLAVSYWGHPRSTQDIDLAVVVSNLKRFESDLREIGLKPAKSNHWIDLGFVRVSQWILPLRDSYIDCKIDFINSDSKFHTEAVSHAITCEFTGVDRELKVLTCEDLLLYKAGSGRLIDLADIQTLYELHRNNLDLDYLRTWALELGFPRDFFEKL